MTQHAATIERLNLHKNISDALKDLAAIATGYDLRPYIFGALFYRFASEKLNSYFSRYCLDYSKLDDSAADDYKKEALNSIGFILRPSLLFFSAVNAAHDNNEGLSLLVHRAFTELEESAKGLKSEKSVTAISSLTDFTSRMLGNTQQDRDLATAKILLAVDKMIDSTDSLKNDSFGDAYEYLMHAYSTNAGKAGGEFYTPPEVSELLAKITTHGKTQVRKVYDPTAGSGSLLLGFAKTYGADNVKQGFYGQEINGLAHSLCSVNMLLHGVHYNNFDIAHGDTLLEPAHKEQGSFDVIVSNPPYSVKWPGDARPDLLKDPRFNAAGVLAPKSKSDAAFVMHSLYTLAEDGAAAIVEAPGLLFRSGAEQKIRRYLVDNNFVDAVVYLPGKLFFGTDMETVILIIKKQKSDSSVLFIDARKECIKSGKNNLLTSANIENILDAYTRRANVQNYCAVVENEMVAENDYNLSVYCYVAPKIEVEHVDIEELNKEIEKAYEELEAARARVRALLPL